MWVVQCVGSMYVCTYVHMYVCGLNVRMGVCVLVSSMYICVWVSSLCVLCVFVFVYGLVQCTYVQHCTYVCGLVQCCVLVYVCVG